MNRRMLILIAGAAIAAGLLIFGDNTPAGAPSAAVVRPRASAAHAAAPAAPASSDAAHGTAPQVAILALAPREELIGSAKSDSPLFASQNWNPPPPPAPSGPPPAPPPPQAPALPFTYIGKSLSAAGWEVFLARGERTYVVQAKAVIDGTYRVDAIAPPFLSLTYLPLNQEQKLNIGVLE